jgi:mycothiol maleylpyruvate isomerase-like protein
MGITRAAALADLDQAGRLVEQRVRADGTFDGWDGRDVLCHLAAYARLVGAILRSSAEHRLPVNTELYGRELTAEESNLTDLDAINAALRRSYEGLSYGEALAFWRGMHSQAVAQAARLTDEQLATPGPVAPPTWWRPHLADVVTALVQHYEEHMASDP